MASCTNRAIMICASVLLLVAASCKSKKALTSAQLPGVTKPSETGLLIRKIKSSENTFNYYSAKGKVSYKDQSTDQDLDVFIVMEKDKYIWMSITALLGIEAARIKITQDSIIILDRLHRKCIVADYQYIKKLTNADLKLTQIQQLIIGNAAFDHDEKQSIADTLASNIAIYTAIGSQKQATFYTPSLKVLKSILEDNYTKKQFTAEYANPYIVGNNAYPEHVNINIRAEKNVECSFRLSNFAFEKKKEVSFSIPGNYEITRP